VSNRKKIKLNVRFRNGKVICAKSPDQCKECNEECEKMELFYYPFSSRDLMECFKNNEKRK
jgi:hypothetical protein